MGFNAISKLRQLPAQFMFFVSTGVAFCAMLPTAQGQIFATNAGTSNIFTDGVTGSIGEYGLDGSTINSALVSSLYGPEGIAIQNGSLFVVIDGGPQGGLGGVAVYNVSGSEVYTGGPAFARRLAVTGSRVFVTTYFVGSVREDSTSATTVNSALITGLHNPRGIAVNGDGTRLFIANLDTGTIGEYDSVTGAPINAALISGLASPMGIAISGSHLYVANSGNGTIGEYNLDGTTVNIALISGLSNPLDVALLDNDLFVVNNGANSIGEYDAATGATINAALITGLASPQGIAVVPEPASWTLLAICGAIVVAFRRQLPGRVSREPYERQQ